MAPAFESHGVVCRQLEWMATSVPTGCGVATNIWLSRRITAGKHVKIAVGRTSWFQV